MGEVEGFSAFSGERTVSCLCPFPSLEIATEKPFSTSLSIYTFDCDFGIL